jgi:hypothetical protein|tara:strand:- start:4266 stop:4835 length:570 start_codon:yes stop_codon:yes gene_type:complete
MANKDAPFGFKLVGKLGSSVQNNGTTEYEIASGATGSIFSGDPVRMTAAGTILVHDAASEQPILGIFRGCQFSDSAGNVTFKSFFPTGQTSTSTITALVEDDPNNLYEVQCTGSLALAAVGANVDLAYTAGSTITGQSKAEVDSGATSAAENFRIIGFSRDPENNERGSANVNVIVKINEHQYTTTTGV